MNLNYPQRRVFRGRGGPTDRRLPKQNARWRQRCHSNTDHHNEDKYGNQTDDENDRISDYISESLDDESLKIIHDECEDEGGLEFVEGERHPGDRNTVDSTKNEQDMTDTISTDGDRSESCIGNSADTTNNSEKEDSPPPPYFVEIRHLKRRIRNVQEISIQTSRDLIASDLTKYEDNVLNATHNCVNEWRSIARHYIKDKDNESGLPTTLRTEIGLSVFQLIQLSVQSGPLSGAKPGYFKRCGAKVAKVVLEFLEKIVPQHEALGIECMGFSSKQMEAMKKWKLDAEKAVTNDKPPSKSVMKKMQRQQQQQQPKKAKKKKKNDTTYHCAF
mmetsp:Transcript_297/g.776  ORF Transcript_297/g.776 Transcript_297/m.776 type:complete len:331 (-) Transcript_297:1845-2837(-)